MSNDDMMDMIDKYMNNSFLRGVKFCRSIMQSLQIEAERSNDKNLKAYIQALKDADKIIERQLPEIIENKAIKEFVE